MQKIAIAAGCVYSVYKIFKFKFMEASEISMETGLEKEQNRHRFLTIQNDAHLTMKQIIPLLSNFYKHFDIVDSITLQLKSLPKGSSLSNKENLWETLKIHAIVKFLSKRYTELSLFFLCNLQMCILANQIHDINQKEYFAFSWYLLEIGTLKIEEKVRKIVNEYVYNISLKERFSKMSFLHLIETLHSEIGASFLLSCLFPTVDELGAVSSKCLKEQMSPEIMKLVQETIDVIQHPDSAKVIDSLFNAMLDDLLDSVFVKESSLPLASIVAGIVRLSDQFDFKKFQMNQELVAFLVIVFCSK